MVYFKHCVVPENIHTPPQRELEIPERWGVLSEIPPWWGYGHFLKPHILQTAGKQQERTIKGHVHAIDMQMVSVHVQLQVYNLKLLYNCHLQCTDVYCTSMIWSLILNLPSTAAVLPSAILLTKIPDNSAKGIK